MSSFDELKLQLQILSAQRETLEIEANAIKDELVSLGPNGESPAGITGPLGI